MKKTIKLLLLLTLAGIFMSACVTAPTEQGQTNAGAKDPNRKIKIGFAILDAMFDFAGVEDGCRAGFNPGLDVTVGLDSF